jgi:hypothetical protein
VRPGGRFSSKSKRDADGAKYGQGRGATLEGLKTNVKRGNSQKSCRKASREAGEVLERSPA